MAKKILIFSMAYFPKHIGGAEVAVKEITDRIKPDEVEFHMLTLHSPGQPMYELIGRVHVHRVEGFSSPDSGNDGNFSSWAKYIYIPSAVVKAFVLHKKYRFDAVWSLMASYAGFAAVIFALFYPKLHFILTLQEGDPIKHILHRARYMYPLFKKIFTRANTVQAISTYLAKFASDMGSECPIEVIPNAVDVEYFASKKSISPALLIPKQPGDVILITTGRLVLKNAVDNVIEALPLLPPHVKFLILGTGHLEKELRMKTADLKVENRVIFGGFVSHKDMPAYLHQSDIFIRPSRSEGFGNSFIEAMAAGIPVIATPVGGIVDFLIHEKTGLLCEVDNPQSIANQVKKLMGDPELRKHIVANASTMAREKYDWKLIAEDMNEKVFKRVV